MARRAVAAAALFCAGGAAAAAVGTGPAPGASAPVDESAEVRCNRHPVRAVREECLRAAHRQAASAAPPAPAASASGKR